MSTIKPKRGNGAPSGLSQYEFAVDSQNRFLYIGNVGGTGDVIGSHATINGLSGAIGISAGSNITISQSGNTLTISTPNIVTSVNGVTGAVTNINAATVTTTSSNSSSTFYPVFAGGAGNTALYVDNVTTPLSYVPSTGTLNIRNLNVANGNTGTFLTTSAIAVANSSDQTYLSPGSLDHEAYTSNSFTITSTNSVKLSGSTIEFYGSGWGYTFPASNGSANQVLTTNGATPATLSWATPLSGITAGGANTFTALQTFSAGISAASGVTFSADISVNGMIFGIRNDATNTLIGNGARDSGSGTNITAIGYEAAKLSTGTTVLAFGYRAAYAQNQDNLVAIGPEAAMSNSGTVVTCIGAAAGKGNAGAGAVLIGYNAGFYQTSSLGVAIGYGAGMNQTGDLNVGVGKFANYANTGYGSVAIGGGALSNSCSGARNTAVGSDCLDACTTGANNTAVGAHSLGELTTGASNVAVGGYAGDLLTTGSDNVILGFEADVAAAGNDNSIVIGKGAVGLGTNTTVIGVAATTAATIYGRLNLPSGLSASGATFSGNISAPNIVTSFNGATGAVQGVSTAVGGTGISVSGATGSVTITYNIQSQSNKAAPVAADLIQINDGSITNQPRNATIGTVLDIIAGDVAVSNTGASTYSGTLSSTKGGLGTNNSAGTNGQILVAQSTSDGDPIIPTLYAAKSLGTGTGISTTTGEGTLQINNTGVLSFNGSTGAVTGITAGGANTFTALQTFSAGITSTTLYASAGVTFNSTSAHTGLATFSGGLTASGATFSGNVNLQDNTLSRVEFLDYFERYVDLGDFTNKGAQIPIDLSTAQVFRTKLTVACIGLTLTNIPDNANANAVGFSLLFVGDGTARTMTWNIGSAGVSWAAGTAPTYTSTANKIDIYSFLSTNGGSNWYGFVGGQNF